jgi:hypothetical protein
MRFRLLSCALLLALVAIRPAIAEQAEQPAPAKLYRRAQESYEKGDYKAVIANLRPILYPTNRLSDSAKAVEAYKMLGVSYVFERERSKAEEAFYAILADDPSHSLDPLIDPPAAVAVFEEVKQRNADRLRQVAERQRLERQRRTEAELRTPPQGLEGDVVVREVERHFFWLNFVPFGAGQFQNGQLTKGFLLLGAQAVLGALSVGSAVALRVAYPDSHPPSNELDTARGLNTTMVVSGALFWATVLYGIIDALVYYESTSVVYEERRGSPREVSVAPAVDATHAGFSLQITF